MKKLVVLVVLAGLFVLPAVALADPPDHANNAIVIRLDEDVCEQRFFDEAGNTWLTTGTVHYVETSNGFWKLTCQGALVEGSTPPDSALVIKSTSEAPAFETCYTPWDETWDWHAHLTPSGAFSLTCVGNLFD